MSQAILLQFFFLNIETTNNHYQKAKKSFQKRLLKGTKILLRKKNEKSINMPLKEKRREEMSI